MWIVYYYFLYYAILFCYDLAIEVSFEKSEYFGEEGSFLWSIRLNATRVQIPFSVQIVPIALDSSRREKKYEATSGELFEWIGLQWLYILHNLLTCSEAFKYPFAFNCSII